MSKFYVGQEVRVFDVNGPRKGQPTGGWVGKIEKIGRKYVTVKYHYTTERFAITDQVVPDSYRHRSFQTLEQAAELQRQAAALATLRESHIELKFGHKYTLAQIERLASVADEIRKGMWT